MQVRDRVAAVGADVEDEAVAALGETFRRRHLLREEVHRCEVRPVVGRHLVGVRHVLARDHQNVRRQHRIDVAERVGEVVLGDLVARHVAGEDLAEQAVVGHGGDGSVRRVGLDGIGGGDDDGSGHSPAEFLRGLRHLVADASAEQAARERVHERSLRTVAEAEATFVGIAIDLAERGVAITVKTSAGRTHWGSLVGAGRDFLVLDDPARPPVIVATAAIASLRPQPADGVSAVRDVAGARAAPLEVGLAGLLARWAAERPRVQVTPSGDEPITGELRAVGLDVVTLRLDGPARAVVHVPISAVTDITLLDA